MSFHCTEPADQFLFSCYTSYKLEMRLVTQSVLVRLISERLSVGSKAQSALLPQWPEWRGESRNRIATSTIRRLAEEEGEAKKESTTTITTITTTTTAVGTQRPTFTTRTVHT